MIEGLISFLVLSCLCLNLKMVLLRLLRHPYIVKYKDFWQEKLHVFIVMEYCQGTYPNASFSDSSDC